MGLVKKACFHAQGADISWLGGTSVIINSLRFRKLLMTAPVCPQCACDYSYHDGVQWICPECAHEWQEGQMADADAAATIKDANGTVLADGDTVVLIKDLKIKGSSQVIKQGTKVKGIRLQEGDHNIACKIDGSGMNLKSEFVKKA